VNAEERDALRASARAMLDRSAPTASVRELLDHPVGFDQALWRDMAELGWLALLVPEVDGGAGAGFGEVVVIAEELGARLTPGPFLASAVLAISALVLGGSVEQRARWLDPLATGEAIGTVALTGPSGRLGDDALGVRCRDDGSALRLDGAAGFVPDAHVADFVVVATTDGRARRLALVETTIPGVDVRPTPTIDHTRRLSQLTFDDVVVDATAAIDDTVFDQLVERAATVLAADGAGAAREILARAVEYSKQRVQFNRPIGSFQAVKHMLADMYVLSEAASVAVEGAAHALDLQPDAAPRLASIAASYARDAAERVAGDAVQAHGGIGFTWEHDCHLYLKRTQLDAALFGDTAIHRGRLAGLLLDAARDRMPA